MRKYPTPIFDRDANGKYIELKEYQKNRITIELNEKVDNIIYAIKREIDIDPHIESVDFIDNGKSDCIYKIISNNKEIIQLLANRGVEVSHDNKRVIASNMSFVSFLYLLISKKQRYKEESANVYTITW